METGIQEIDDQHQELIARINKVIGMDDAGRTEKETKETLDFLAQYVVKHFSTEDVYMNRCAYPMCYLHQDQHSGFVETFTELRNKFEKSGYSHELATELNAFIVTWVVNHIATSDANFGRYYLTTIGANPDDITVDKLGGMNEKTDSSSG